jgi:hypothetical protein
MIRGRRQDIGLSDLMSFDSVSPKPLFDGTTFVKTFPVFQQSYTLVHDHSFDLCGNFPQNQNHKYSCLGSSSGILRVAN